MQMIFFIPVVFCLNITSLLGTHKICNILIKPLFYQILQLNIFPCLDLKVLDKGIYLVKIDS